MEQTYFRRGFGLKSEIESERNADYFSGVVELLRAHNNRLEVGPLTFRLAQEYGFCYGVDRAVDYAYETRHKFPDRRIFLVGEIIHNPHVNGKLAAMGITFLKHNPEAQFDFSMITEEDVVIIPAFGVTKSDFERLRSINCILVDSTCGSVLNVWKRVESYARDGFTAAIHGKHYHEETQATASQALKHPDGRFLIFFDAHDVDLICEMIAGRSDPDKLAEHFSKSVSAGFDFSSDLKKIGVANQTTMLAGESLQHAFRIRKALAARYGEEHIDDHFRSFDTLCSATQERQDAVAGLMEDPPDAMVVVGGYNSSNTCALAALAQSFGVPTYHIEDSSCVNSEAGTIRHQPVRTRSEVVVGGWLEKVCTIGITAGASTPNNKIGETVARICESRGVKLPSFVEA